MVSSNNWSIFKMNNKDSLYWRTEQLINSIEGNCLIDQCIVKLNQL